MRGALLVATFALLTGCQGSATSSASASAAPSAASSATSSGALAVGDAAPDVTFAMADGKKVALSSLKGKFVLVYFYPQDDTPGCTIEAKGIHDAWKDFQDAGIEVYGVSGQGAASHKDFAEKYELQFPLATDEDGAIAAAFHVPFNAHHAKRQSFLVGKDGKIKATWLNVDPSTHAGDVLAAAKG